MKQNDHLAQTSEDSKSSDGSLKAPPTHPSGTNGSVSPTPYPRAPPAPQSSHIARKYRPYHGELRDRPAIIWDMAVIEFIRTLNRKWTKIMLVVVLFIAIMVSIFSAPELLSETGGEYDPAISIEFYSNLTFFAITFTAITAGRYISSDLADKSLHLYLVRPISKADYLAARLLSSMMILSLVTIVPNIISWMTMMGLAGGSWAIFLDNLWTLGATILYGLFYILVFSLVGLAFSASTPRRNWSIVGIFIAFLFTLNFADILALISNNDIYYHISVTRNLEVIGYQLVRVDSIFDLQWGRALGILALICATCVGFIIHRLSNVEGKI